RFSLDRVEFLGDALRGAVARIGEAPRLSPSFESTVSGLHFVGFAAASMFGPSMRFVCGSAAAAELTARAVARDARSRSRRRPVRQVKDDLLVLCYHGVSATWESYLAVRPKALAAQLGYLAARGYRTVGFTETV